jgi:hypothetical protein
MKQREVRTTIIQIPSRPMSLHECTYESETNTLIEDNGYELLNWRDAELRVRVNVTKEASQLVTDELVKQVYEGAFSYKIERIIIPSERIRCAEIAIAQKLSDKLIAWGTTVEKEIPAEVIEMANTIEQECYVIEG